MPEPNQIEVVICRSVFSLGIVYAPCGLSIAATNVLGPLVAISYIESLDLIVIIIGRSNAKRIVEVKI